MMRTYNDMIDEIEICANKNFTAKTYDGLLRYLSSLGQPDAERVVTALCAKAIPSNVLAGLKQTWEDLRPRRIDRHAKSAGALAGYQYQYRSAAWWSEFDRILDYIGTYHSYHAGLWDWNENAGKHVLRIVDYEPYTNNSSADGVSVITMFCAPKHDKVYVMCKCDENAEMQYMRVFETALINAGECAKINPWKSHQMAVASMASEKRGGEPKAIGAIMAGVA